MILFPPPSTALLPARSVFSAFHPLPAPSPSPASHFASPLVNLLLLTLSFTYCLDPSPIPLRLSPHPKSAPHPCLNLLLCFSPSSATWFSPLFFIPPPALSAMCQINSFTCGPFVLHAQQVGHFCCYWRQDAEPHVPLTQPIMVFTMFLFKEMSKKSLCIKIIFGTTPFWNKPVLKVDVNIHKLYWYPNLLC